MILKTAECVTPMHPDKICDRISDAILDECLKQDENSRVAIETMGGHNIITITGELTTNAYVDIPEVVRRIVGNKYGIQINIAKQSHEISRGVDIGGAGDQGIMVGYACKENESMIPQELYLAREICKFIYARHQSDGKTQVTINYSNEVIAIVASFCGISGKKLEKMVTEWLLIKGILPAYNPDIYCNPAGDWEVGGFSADTGLTGRKLAVDNYGPQIPIGGGAFSGKDATKVDRSAAYMARKIAVDLLKGSCDANEVIVKLAYSIGVPHPVMVVADIDGSEVGIEQLNYKLTPTQIIQQLGLRKPQFEKTAEWGHFGNGFAWDE